MADSKKDDEISRVSGGHNPYASTTTLTADQLWEQATSGSTLHRMLTRAGIDSRTVFESAIADDTHGGSSTPSDKLAELLSLISDPTYSDDKEVEKTPKVKMAEPGTVPEDWTPRSPAVLRRMRRDAGQQSPIKNKDVAEADPNMSTDEGSVEVSDVDEDLAPAEMVDDDEQYAGDDEHTLSAHDDERVPPKKAPSVMKTSDQPKQLLSALDLLTYTERRRGQSSDRILIERTSAEELPPVTKTKPAAREKPRKETSLHGMKASLLQVETLAENTRAPSGFQDNNDGNDDQSTASTKKKVTIFEDGKVTSTRDSLSAIAARAKTKYPGPSSTNASTDEFVLEVYDKTPDLKSYSGDDADDEMEDFRAQSSYHDTEDTIRSIPNLPPESSPTPVPTASTLQMSTPSTISFASTMSAPKSILKPSTSRSDLSTMAAPPAVQPPVEILEYHRVRNVSGQQTGHTISEKQDDTVTTEEFEAARRASEKKKEEEAKIREDEEAIRKELTSTASSGGKRLDDDGDDGCDDPACKLLDEDEELQKLNKEYTEVKDKLKEAQKQRLELLSQVEHLGPLKKGIQEFTSLPAIEEAVCLADNMTAAVTEVASMAFNAMDTMLLCKPRDKSTTKDDGEQAAEVADEQG